MRRAEEVDRLLGEHGVVEKVSNSPPRVQSPTKVSARGPCTLHTFASHRHKSGRSRKDRRRGRVKPAGVASLSWRATRKGSLRCEIFNLFGSSSFSGENVTLDFQQQSLTQRYREIFFYRVVSHKNKTKLQCVRGRTR